LTAKLIEKKIINRLITDNSGRNHLTGVRDTSDQNWPEPLQMPGLLISVGVS
jgi:hypothetical protein